MAEGTGAEMSPDQEREALARRPFRRYAAFTSSDGSPGYSEEQGLDETDEDFFQRMKKQEATGGGYISCDFFITTRDSSMNARLLHEKGVPLENLKALDVRERLKPLAQAAIQSQFGDAWEVHRYSNFHDELDRWHSGGSKESHEVCPWPDIDFVIDTVVDAIAPKIVGLVTDKDG